MDDDRDTAQTLAYLLVGMGHEATFLTDPTQVVETAKRTQPHVVFLDLSMPAMNGWEVAKLLRREYPHGGRLSLVAISGHGDEQARVKSRKAGFDAHVVKPVAADLVAVIMKQLDPRC